MLKRALAGTLAALALIVAGCGDDSDTTTSADTTTQDDVTTTLGDTSTTTTTVGDLPIDDPEVAGGTQADIGPIGTACPGSVPFGDTELSLVDQMSEPPSDDVFSSPLICVFAAMPIRAVLNAERPYPGTEGRWDDIVSDTFGAADCARCAEVLGAVPYDLKVRGDSAHEVILSTLRNRHICTARLQQLPPEPPDDAVIDFLLEANEAICAPAGA